MHFGETLVRHIPSTDHTLVQEWIRFKERLRKNRAVQSVSWGKPDFIGDYKLTVRTEDPQLITQLKGRDRLGGFMTPEDKTAIDTIKRGVRLVNIIA